jgi:septum formation protein
MALWLAHQPLVLASKSASRRAILEAAAIPIEIHPADIDEREIELRAGACGPGQVAALLARSKAAFIAGQRPGRLVLGADQTMGFGEQVFSKPANRVAAGEQLKALRGQTHELHSAIALARDGMIAFEHCDVARLTMRMFSDAFLESYLDASGDAVTASVGAYQLERSGIHLFERIEGDHFTILGLPLLPLIEFLRRDGWLVV